MSDAGHGDAFLRRVRSGEQGREGRSTRVVPVRSLSTSTVAEPKRNSLAFQRGGESKAWTVTWLILPVVICLSQRLSHACPSINELCTVKLRMAH